jgi:glycosyltransferase involved in cell wall biosynthesis
VPTPGLIFFSLEDWDDIWRRNQFVCATLARRHPDMQILFLGLPRNVARHLRRGSLKPLLHNPTRTIEGLPNITFTAPLRIGPEVTNWGLRLNERLAEKHILKQVRALRMNNPILWFNNHRDHRFTNLIPHSRVIYDITDDWLTAKQSDLDRQRTTAADQWLCQNADAVIVCSEHLQTIKKPLTPAGRLHLIPNGVDAAHYASVTDPSLPIAPPIAALEKPVLGYTGTLHTDRLDIPLLEQLAARLAKGTIALVGPSSLEPAAAARLHACPRIKMLPAVPYQKIPEVMRGFDICITPHVVSPFTESLNPLKLFEYLAAGKPIISTPVAGFRDHPTLVHLATTPDQFLEKIPQALTEPASQKSARRAEAQKHSWDSRVDRIESLLHPNRDPVAQGQSPAIAPKGQGNVATGGAASGASRAAAQPVVGCRETRAAPKGRRHESNGS